MSEDVKDPEGVISRAENKKSSDSERLSRLQDISDIQTSLAKASSVAFSGMPRFKEQVMVRLNQVADAAVTEVFADELGVDFIAVDSQESDEE